MPKQVTTALRAVVKEHAVNDSLSKEYRKGSGTTTDITLLKARDCYYHATRWQARLEGLYCTVCNLPVPYLEIEVLREAYPRVWKQKITEQAELLRAFRMYRNLLVDVGFTLNMSITRAKRKCQELISIRENLIRLAELRGLERRLVGKGRGVDR